MSRSVGGSAGSVAHDERDRHLAPIVVGDAEHRDVGDLRVAVEHVLDFLGRDVLALAHDDVLDAAGDDHRSCSSKRAMSPVCNQPSSVNAAASSELST